MLNSSIQKILVPLDGSKTSMRGFRFALDIAKPSQAKILGLNILPMVSIKSQKLKRKILGNGEKTVNVAKKLAEKEGIVFIGYVKFHANIGRSIVEFSSKEHVDMIVMGSKGPDPEFSVFLGSVANYVIHKSKIPVTIVK